MMLDTPDVAEAGAVSAVAQASFRATFSFMNYPPADLAAFLDSAMGETRYAAQIADPAYALRVARDASGAVTGFIKAGPNDLPLAAMDDDRATTWELHQLYLLEAAQGSGVANAMMAWLEGEARTRGYRALYLSVYVDNHRAKRFYARHGFVEVGKNPFQVGDTVDDDRVWRKPL
jgi:ribosomal protein S18 acetylase RimI-like enzyme